MQYEKKIVNEFTRSSLKKLIDRQYGVIHIKQFYQPKIAKILAKKSLTHSAIGSYKKDYLNCVNRIYTPHVDTRNDPVLKHQYHAAAVTNIQELRSFFYPYISPSDYIRLMLEEYWPMGAQMQKLHAKPCFTGAIRVFNPSTSTFYPHFDRLEGETDAPEPKEMLEQLSANIYLQTAKQGGELQLWLREPSETENKLIRSSNGLLPEKIEAPAVSIRPSIGDLIIFSSRMLHAVRPTPKTHRVGMACFIGYYGRNKPLTYWS